MENLSKYRVLAHLPYRFNGFAYDFPNGHTASVIPDPHEPMRFEVEIDGSTRLTFAGLTTEQAEAKLAETAALTD